MCAGVMACVGGFRKLLSCMVFCGEFCTLLWNVTLPPRLVPAAPPILKGVGKVVDMAALAWKPNGLLGESDDPALPGGPFTG